MQKGKINTISGVSGSLSLIEGNWKSIRIMTLSDKIYNKWCAAQSPIESYCFKKHYVNGYHLETKCWVDAIKYLYITIINLHYQFDEKVF